MTLLILFNQAPPQPEDPNIKQGRLSGGGFTGVRYIVVPGKFNKRKRLTILEGTANSRTTIVFNSYAQAKLKSKAGNSALCKLKTHFASTAKGRLVTTLVKTASSKLGTQAGNIAKAKLRTALTGTANGKINRAPIIALQFSLIEELLSSYND